VVERVGSSTWAWQNRRVGFLKRIFGGSRPDASPAPSTPPSANGVADGEADERAYELEIARAEQDRLDDLTRRQLRYADYAWEPPKQGGERRADDDADSDEPG
jgi:hypothetical protein